MLQKHYRTTRSVALKEVNVSDITGVCMKCKYVELKPTCEIESTNGGLMVPRKGLLIVNEKGKKITKLRSTPTRKVNQYWGCNHCVNKW